MENNCEKNFNCNTSVGHNKRSAVSIRLYEAIRSGMKAFIRSSGHTPLVLKIFSIGVFSVFFSYQGYSQSDIDYAVYANIVYRFTKYIDWPENKKNGDFVIGIVGDSPLYDELKNFISNKRVGSQKIKLKKFSSSESSFNCHILFISEEKSNSLKKIVAITKGTSTLLVSESDGLARKGACINFIVIEDHLKLEINKTNIEERELSIATELLSLGIIIK